MPQYQKRSALGFASALVWVGGAAEVGPGGGVCWEVTGLEVG